MSIRMFVTQCGLHPCYVKDSYEDDLTYLKLLLTINTIAIGEIGIDLHWNKSNLEIQKSFYYPNKLGQRI